MKRKLSTIYAVCCTLLLAGAFLLVFYFAWKSDDVENVIAVLAGFAISLFLAPVFHELGHIAFADITKMQVMYAKFFCFKIVVKNKKSRPYFASPFAPDETQAVPKTGGDMRRRASWYTLGGLIFSSGFFAAVLIAAVICSVLNATNFALWGMVPYAAYLLFLNLAPLEYPSGKTDSLVYCGIQRGEDAEKNMLAAMEIQGNLYAGKSYTEIDETLYFNQPQLCEDEPLFAVMLDLRYRYYLEKEEYDNAADCLNRLANAQAYLPQEEVEKLAAELTYMHALKGDLQSAQQCAKLCENFLKTETAVARRVLAVCAFAGGKTDEAVLLKESAEKYLEKELITGVVKAEKILLSRICAV